MLSNPTSPSPRAPLVLLAGLGLAAVSAAYGCVDPEGRLDEYLTATDGRRGGGGAGGGIPTGCTSPDGTVPDPTGDFLVSCVTRITGRDPELPLRFRGKLTYVADAGSKGTIAMELTPLLTSATTLGQVEGGTIVVPPTDVTAACGFAVGLGKVDVPGTANTISMSDITLDPASIAGTILSKDLLCSELGGQLAKPFPFDLEPGGDTCVFVRCDGGDACVLPTLGKTDYECKSGGAGGAGGASGAAGAGGGGAAGSAGGGGAGAGGSAGTGGGGEAGSSGSAGAGGPWSCAGGVVTTTSTVPTIDVTLEVVNGLGGTPVSGAVVKACARTDEACASPLTGPSTTGADGKVVMAGLPADGAGWDGYFEINAATFFPTIRMFPFPLTSSGAQKASLASAGLFGSIGSGITGQKLDPARAELQASTATCDGDPKSPGVVISIASGDAATKVAYGGTVPDKLNPATTDSGGVSRAFGFDVPPGPTTVTASLMSDGTTIQTWPVLFRAGYSTSIALEPKLFTPVN